MKSPSFFCVCVKVLLFVGDLLFKGFVKILVPPLPGHLLQMGMGIHLIRNTFNTKTSNFFSPRFSLRCLILTDGHSPPHRPLAQTQTRRPYAWKCFLLNTCQFESFYWTLANLKVFTEHCHFDFFLLNCQFERSFFLEGLVYFVILVKDF